MGLLNYITATSLDEDYAQTSARRTAPSGDGPASARNPATGVSALLVLSLFGLLVATAFVQTSRTASDAQVRHDQLVQQVLARRAELEQQRSRAEDLRSETETLRRANLQATAEGRSVQSRLDRLGVSSGVAAARGPGVRVVVDDGPTTIGEDAEVIDLDLQKLVNGLWLSGAEAIAVNDERLTSLSAIRLAGGVITVNYDRVSGPYTVDAIGDPETLAAEFVDTPGGEWWRNLRALYGLEFRIDRVESLTLPAATSVNLRHAHVPETLR